MVRKDLVQLTERKLRGRHEETIGLGQVVKGQTTQDFVVRDLDFIQEAESHWSFLKCLESGERMGKSDRMQDWK